MAHSTALPCVAAGNSRPYGGLVLSLLVGAFMSVVTASAEEAPGAEADKWKVTGEVYLWGATIDGRSASDSDFQIDFSDIMDDLEFALMGNLAARRDKWTLFGDVIYLNLSDSGSNAASLPIGRPSVPVKVDAKIDLKAWIVDALAGYNLIENEKGRLDIMGGVRYLHLDMKTKVNRERAGPRPDINRKFTDSGSNWDGVVGVSGNVNLSEKWYLPYYVDVGTGDSQVTYQAAAGVGYRFKRVDVVANYRYLKWKFDDNDVFDYLAVKGPMIGVKYTF